jgi:WD40 repeat protein
MTTWLPRLIALPLLLPLFAAAPPAGPSSAEVARLIEQLGDDDFHTREAATARLKMAGEPALDALHEATKGKDPEVRRRARRIVFAIENRLYGPELRLTGHTGTVWSVCVSADGERVLTSGDDKTLRLWDAYTGKQLRVFTGHSDHVYGAALSPDGKRVLSSSGDKTVRLWDVSTGKQLLTMTGHTHAVFSVGFGPDGKVLSGGTDGTVRLWDPSTGKQAAVITALLVQNVTYSDRARLAVTYCQLDHSKRLWDLRTGKMVRSIPGHGGVSSVCFSPDGKLLASTCYDGGLCLWAVATGNELKRFDHRKACCAAFSPDGKGIASGGEDGVVRLWDARSGKELHKYEGHTGQVIGVAFFPDGRRIASVGKDGTVRVWRVPR